MSTPAVTAFEALCDWAERYKDEIGELSAEVDLIEGAPTQGASGGVYANYSPGDMHIRIDIPRRPEATP